MTGSLPDDLVGEFLAEFREMLERMSLNLSMLEKKGHSKEVVRDIYRDIHTLKGNAMMFGLGLTGRLNHSAENVLDPIRERDLTLSKNVCDLLFRVFDLNQIIIKEMSHSGKEPDIGDQVDILTKALEKELLILQNSGTEVADPPKVSAVVHGEKREVVANNIKTPVANPKAASKKPKNITQVAAQDDGSQESIRVNIGILDNFMNLIGELVLVRNRLTERAKELGDEDVSISHQLNSITRELQNEVMKTRMQPVGNVVNKFHRVIRDLARDLQKEILVNISGAETELDRSLLDAIKDPLMHIVRNCADHGIEIPEIREKNGKTKQGNIHIAAYHEGGQVKIDIRDDGQGINPERVKKKAVEKGIINERQATTLSDVEIFDLIFMPGFSTAESISNVSGRGVGMDVVKTNIEKIGGSVRLNSKFGHGTTTTLEIPLTLAIMQALIVKVGRQRYAIPQNSLSQLIQIYPENENAIAIEFLQGKPVFRLRGELIPLVILDNILQLDSGLGTDYSEVIQAKKEMLNIAIINSNGKTFGTLVSAIEDSIDIVVKPLGPILQSIPVLSGATILGNGDIALTLDVSALSQLAGIGTREAMLNSSPEALNHHDGSGRDEIDYLLVSGGASENIVIPLCNVHRLEELPSKDLQHSGGLLVFPYRKTLLPIFDLARELDLSGDEISGGEFISVVVVKQSERMYGLRVEKISDIITAKVELSTKLRDRPGIEGGFAQDDKVYLVLDFAEIVDRCLKKMQLQSLVQPNRMIDVAGKRQHLHILLAEDSNFFRRQIAEYLRSAGFKVTAMENGAKAWNEFNHNDVFDLIVSDIEMPEMDGYALATKVRGASHKSDIPMIAVTSKFGSSDVKKGMASGFNKYLQKLNKEELINEIDQILRISA